MWWWSIYTRGVDVSIQNSWIPYRNVNKDIPLLEFRRSNVKYYLRRSKNLPDHPHNRFSTKESSIDFGVSDSIRLDGYMHLIQATSEDRKRRFAGVGCSSRVQTERKKSKLGLCITCFVPFHEQ